jgi:hypothetical protein
MSALATIVRDGSREVTSVDRSPHGEHPGASMSVAEALTGPGIPAIEARREWRPALTANDA